jgi:hypothetical protein
MQAAEVEAHTHLVAVALEMVVLVAVAAVLVQQVELLELAELAELLMAKLDFTQALQ